MKLKLTLEITPDFRNKHLTDTFPCFGAIEWENEKPTRDEMFLLIREQVLAMERNILTAVSNIVEAQGASLRGTIYERACNENYPTQD